MAVTLYDVAKEAGVSMKTAARVLSGEKTLEKNYTIVLQAAQRLKYVKNFSAAKLAQHRYKSVGVVIPSLTNPFYAFFAETIFREAHLRGFQVLLGNSFGDTVEEEKCLRSFLEYSVSGVILNASDDSQPTILTTWLPLFKSRNIPLIIAGWPVADMSGWEIRIGNVAGMKRMVNHLVSKGHRRIAFLSSKVETLGHRERLHGFALAMREHGLDASQIRFGPFAAESGRELALDLLKLNPRPTAIVTVNDLMALGVYQAAYELGLNVPRDIAVAGFDDIPLSRLVRPSLTTVRQPQEKIAADCIALIERCFDSGTLPVACSLSYEPELIIRESA
jgi:LacI family transcriptional regulator